MVIAATLLLMFHQYVCIYIQALLYSSFKRGSGGREDGRRNEAVGQADLKGWRRQLSVKMSLLLKKYNRGLLACGRWKLGGNETSVSRLKSMLLSVREKDKGKEEK